MSKYPDPEKAPDGILSCNCGSGKPTTTQVDGYGIFLCRTCPSCHATKMRKYRSDIHDRYECDEPVYGEDDY